MLQRPPAGSIPDAPGSYQFRDADGRVIYVGKASSLRARLSNYFQNPANLLPRTAQMVASAETVEWIQVRNDVEALMLEYSLIKQYQPRFNVRLRDDKSYPFLAVTVSDEWPRAMVRRGAKQRGDRYFGPYAHAYAIRDTLDSLLRTFPIRTCSDNKFHVHQKQGRPCLLFHIEKCSGPCIEAVEPGDYERLIHELLEFLDGDTEPVIRRLEADMQTASDNLEFERAARLRDRLSAVHKAIEKQQMVVERAEDLDCFGIVEDELEAAVQVFYVRRGRVVGRKGFIVDKVEDLTRPQLVANILEQHYADPTLGVPALILVPDTPDEQGVLESWLGVLRAGGGESPGTAGQGAGRAGQRAGRAEWWAARSGYRVERSVDPTARRGRVVGGQGGPAGGQGGVAGAQGGPVGGQEGVIGAQGGASRLEVRAPRRGEKRALLEMVTRNAGEEFARHRLKRAADHNARARALNSLQDALGLPDAPLRIECYDMSHLQGRDYVGSMVVMEDGMPRRSEYRRFKIKTVDQNDDFAAMGEVLTRRLRAYLVDREKPVDDRRRRFAYPPQLLLVDGGKGQLGVAERVVAELGLQKEIPLAALAKQFEEVFVPGRPDPLRIPRGSDALYLLQQIRDEAHRFAITYHRSLRDRRMTRSVLDDIPGLGETRRKRLIRELGGVRAVRDASFETLEGLPWLPDTVALAVYEKLHGGEISEGPAGSENGTAGEEGEPAGEEAAIAEDGRSAGEEVESAGEPTH